MAAITAEGLVKVFPSRSGEVRALDGVDLEVPTGSVLGLLGPNGAGKTTAVRILTTLLTPDSGRATVNGIDVAADPQGVRRSIGLSGQYAAVDEYLTGRENLVMVGRLYHFDMAAVASPGHRTPRAVRPRGGGRPTGEDLLGGHAPQAGPRRSAGCPAPDHLPG